MSVRFNFDSSGTLAEQILRGAPADVFASANPANLADLAAENRLSGKPFDIAQNALAIVTKPGNPAGIEGLADLATAGVVSSCSLDAPCGRLAAEVLDRAEVRIPERSISRGQNVKSTLTAVTEGDAVAAIVYVTDARAAGGRVATVEIPQSVNAIATYPAAVLADTTNPTAAQAFLDFLLSDAAQKTLATFGFLPPTS